jgi:SAM-dependent methyltransferase
MCDYFARHCAAEVAAGTVRLNVGAYRDFLASRQLSGGHDIDLVVANFAPLNLVDDLPPLFAKFDTMLNAGGRLLVSVLNPFYRGQLASRRGWTRLPQLLWNGSYTTLLHGMIPVRRWLPGRLARQAEPFFQLAAIYIPLTTAPGEPAGRVSLARHFERSGAHEPA